MALQESGEMYLETIYVLSQKRNIVRSIDAVEENGALVLNEAGQAIGRKIYAHHEILTELLVKLGVDRDAAAEDACKMEHAISDTTFEAIPKRLQEDF